MWQEEVACSLPLGIHGWSNQLHLSSTNLICFYRLDLQVRDLERNLSHSLLDETIEKLLNKIQGTHFHCVVIKRKTFGKTAERSALKILPYNDMFNPRIDCLQSLGPQLLLRNYCQDREWYTVSPRLKIACSSTRNVKNSFAILILCHNHKLLNFTIVRH